MDVQEIKKLFLKGYSDVEVVDRVGLGRGEIGKQAVAVVQAAREAYAHGCGSDRNVWEFYQDESSKHRWRCSDRNGEILFVSSQGYSRLEDAEKSARRAGWPG